MICFIKITHGSRVCLTLSEVVDEEAAAAALIVVIGVLRMHRDDDETKAAVDVGRETAMPLLRATDKARNLAVFVSASAGIGMTCRLWKSLQSRNWKLRLRLWAVGCLHADCVKTDLTVLKFRVLLLDTNTIAPRSFSALPLDFQVVERKFRWCPQFIKARGRGMSSKTIY